MKEEIEKIILTNLIEFCKEKSIEIDVSNGRKTRLYGGDGKLDSLALVSFIVMLEESLEEKTGFSLILADERAMSRRTSPFASVGLLTDYVYELINTENTNV